MELLDGVLLGGLMVCFTGASVLAAAEVSIVRVRRSTVVVEARSAGGRAGHLLRLLDDLPAVLNAVLLLALGLQVSAAALTGALAGRWFGGLAVPMASIVLTAALFVYAEAVPKTRAMGKPYATAIRLTPVLRLVVRVMRPAVAALVWLAGRQAPGQVPAVGALTEREIRVLTRESAEVGAIDESDAELVARSFEFNDRRVAEVMVGTGEISAVPQDLTVGEALSLAIDVGHRRLPVHARDLDEILGIVRLRDLAAATASGHDRPVASLISEVLRCGPDEPISALLGAMQRSRSWMAIVTADDGRTLGLATVEDLVAELVGEIEDDRDVGDRHPGPGRAR